MSMKKMEWWWTTLETDLRKNVARQFPGSTPAQIENAVMDHISGYKNEIEPIALLYELGRRFDPKMKADKNGFPPWPKFRGQRRLFPHGLFNPQGIYDRPFEYIEYDNWEGLANAHLFLPQRPGLSQRFIGTFDLNADDAAIVRHVKMLLAAQRKIHRMPAPPQNTWKQKGAKLNKHWNGIQKMDLADMRDHGDSSAASATRKFALKELTPEVLGRFYKARIGH
jgi:hypothetical protein